MDNNKKILLGVIRELYGRIVYTHKTHEKEREIWSKKVCRNKWVNILLVGATFLSSVAGAISNERWVFYLTTLLGALSIGHLIYGLSFNPEKTELEHRSAAKSLLKFREQSLMLITKCMIDSSSLASIQDELESIQREVSIIYNYCPDTSTGAYEEAKKGLKEGEELTFSNEEIDRLLPLELKISSNPSLKV